MNLNYALGNKTLTMKMKFPLTKNKVFHIDLLSS